MEDNLIVQLFLERREDAIEELKTKYEPYCHTIAFNILGNNEDCEECINDAFLRIWNSIPPNKPENLSAYVGKVTRNLALDRIRQKGAERRGGGETELVLDELIDCISGEDELERREDSREILQAINSFLEGLNSVERGVFMRRYWLAEPIANIASRYNMSLSKASSMLHRLRGRLKKHMEKEGIVL